MRRLIERGVRLTIEAEKILARIEDKEKLEKVIDTIITTNRMFVSKDDLCGILEGISPDKAASEDVCRVEEVVVKRSDYRPLAKEYEANIAIDYKREVTGKSRTTGSVDDFVSFFRNRYERVARLLYKPSKYATVELENIKRYINDKVKIIVMVSNKHETKQGNLLLEVEDLTGQFKVVISKKDEKVFERGRGILNDDVIAIYGKILEPYMIAEDFEWPDMPVTREKKLAENDLAVAYLSDLHFGSKYFLERYLARFKNWLHGKEGDRELAGKVKYIIVAGDIVDGIGIYPNQEKELIVKDVYKQYEMFSDFVASIPDYIKIIAIPGNHDAVRRGEPMPAISNELVKSDFISLGNPAMLSIENVKHLVYHGTSMDSMIASVPKLSYTKPEEVMVEYMKRRHLSPIYGGNLIVPERIDYFVIDEEPDVLHVGHVHKNGYKYYRGTTVINSGTFQDRTEFQMKQGHVPTPGIVPVYELKNGNLRVIDFKIEG